MNADRVELRASIGTGTMRLYITPLGRKERTYAAYSSKSDYQRRAARLIAYHQGFLMRLEQQYTDIERRK